MLVLTRACDEEIRIGHDVVIRVLDVKGDRVRIGIKAPMEIPVHRQEVYEEIERNNRAATQLPTQGLAGATELFKKKQTQQKQGSKKDRETPPEAARTEVNHGA